MAVSADLYRTFLGVGLYLSFSRAAKELGVSQSAISQSIKQLEGELNMPLFVRTTKSVGFTPEGKELFDTVAKAFSILDNGVTQLQERVSQAYESLNLAATDTLCRHSYCLISTNGNYKKVKLAYISLIVRLLIV